MRFKKLYLLGRTISLWLTAFYLFLVCFIIAISLARRYLIDLEIIFAIFVAISIGLLSLLLYIFKQQSGKLSVQWKKVLLISFLPFLYIWVAKKYHAVKVVPVPDSSTHLNDSLSNSISVQPETNEK